jgi:hypothetical protein
MTSRNHTIDGLNNASQTPLLNAPKISAPVTPKMTFAGLLLNNGIAIILKEKMLVTLDRKVEIALLRVGL